MTAEDDERIKDFFYHQMYGGGGDVRHSTSTNSTFMGDHSRNTMMSRQTQRGAGLTDTPSYMMNTETRMPTVRPRSYATYATTSSADILAIDPKELGKEF